MKNITKASGEQETFSTEKLRRSLQRIGVEPMIITKLIEHIEHAPELKSTRDIYNYVFSYLKAINRTLASRYNLKNAIYELGPSGFPFEKFIAEVFRVQKYAAQVDQIIQGFCVEHEVDIVAFSVLEKKHFMVECKFHNQPGLKSDVKVVLYVKARFDDIAAMWNKIPGHQDPMFHQAWLVSNTKFTTQAIKYAECAGINLLGWSFPFKNNLAELIDTFGVHPVTCLTTLTRQQKHALIARGFVLCRDLEKRKYLLKEVGIDDADIGLVLEEIRGLCDIHR